MMSGQRKMIHFPVLPTIEKGKVTIEITAETLIGRHTVKKSVTVRVSYRLLCLYVPSLPPRLCRLPIYGWPQWTKLGIPEFCSLGLTIPVGWDLELSATFAIRF